MLFKIKLLLEYISNEQVFISKVLELYRYIIRWQTGKKTPTIENKIRNISDEVWQPISRAFTQWQIDHGFGDTEHWLEFIGEIYGDSYFDELIDKIISEGVLVFAEDEDGELDYDDIKSIDTDQLQFVLKDLDVVGLKIFNNNESIQSFTEVLEKYKNSLNLYWEIKKEMYFALRKHWKFSSPEVYSVARNIDNIINYYNSGDVDKIIIAIDQAIDLQHVTGSIFDYSGLEINSDDLRDEINKLGNFKLPVTV